MWIVLWVKGRRSQELHGPFSSRNCVSGNVPPVLVNFRTSVCVMCSEFCMLSPASARLGQL